MIMNELLKILNKEEVLDKIHRAGIREFGTINEELTEKLNRFYRVVRQEGEPVLAAGALNNHDVSYMLLDILKKDTEKVLKGLGVMAWLTDAEEMLLYLPENETELAEKVQTCAEAMDMDVRVEYGIADMRLLRNGMVSHIQTLAAVADVLDGRYEAKTYAGVVRYTTAKTCEAVSAPCYIPFGTKVTEITGSLDKIKAVQIGDSLYQPEEVSQLVITEKTALGDGVIRLYTEGCCMLDAVFTRLLESRRKSCGKCTFCREGLIQLYSRMKEIVSGKGELSSLKIMEGIGQAMTYSSLCTIGNSGSALLLGTLEKFENEYLDHIKRKKCTAGSCLAFVNIYIDPEKCTGCGQCQGACEGNYIEGLEGYIHMIEDFDCSKCGKCAAICPEKAIISTTGRVPRLPDRLTKTGRFKRY